MSGEELSLGIGNGFSISSVPRSLVPLVPWSLSSYTGGIASTTGTPAGGVK